MFYFSLQKSRFLADCSIPSDSLLVYDDEDQYSAVGSLDNCSILEADNDLGFLSDLDRKFMNLATICSPPPPKLEQVEQIVQSVNTSMISVDTSESSVATGAVQVLKSDPPPTQQSTVTNVAETINKSESINTSSTVLMQQQPLYCLVERPPPTTVFLAEEPVQGMYLINGLAGAQGLVLQGSNILQNGVEQQGMYLIDGMSMYPGNVMLGNCPNLVNAGGLALSPVLLQGEKGIEQLQGSPPQDAQAGKSVEKTGVESGKVKNTNSAKLQVKSKK